MSMAILTPEKIYSRRKWNPTETVWMRRVRSNCHSVRRDPAPPRSALVCRAVPGLLQVKGDHPSRHAEAHRLRNGPGADVEFPTAGPAAAGLARHIQSNSLPLAAPGANVAAAELGEIGGGRASTSLSLTWSPIAASRLNSGIRASPSLRLQPLVQSAPRSAARSIWRSRQI